MQKHPDADAFIREYLTRPTDATTRLVFADWLEETGAAHNAAWAHFIRLREEAVRHDSDSRERRELLRQADEYVPQIRARLTISANLFVGYPKSLLQLLPAANITVRLADFAVPIAILDIVPESVARENLVLPLDMQGRTLLVAAVAPTDAYLVEKLEFILNREIVFVAAEREDVLEAINRGYGETETETVSSILIDFATIPFDADTDLGVGFSGIGAEPIVRAVNLTISEAINLRADRILLTPDGNALSVRFRIDGEWVERGRLPLPLFRPVPARFAIMAGIPVEWAFQNPPSLTPMTGAFPLHVHGRLFRIRVTVQPSPDGPTTQIDLVRELPITF